MQDKIDILLAKVIDIQNLDGSFGKRNKSIFTSYYLIAMVLYNKLVEPFTFSLKKALLYIIENQDKTPESYIALKLIRDRTIHNKREISRIITYRESKDMVGNLIYLYRSLIEDVKKFSKIMFNRPMDKYELIYYLFDEILKAK